MKIKSLFTATLVCLLLAGCGPEDSATPAGTNENATTPPDTNEGTPTPGETSQNPDGAPATVTIAANKPLFNAAVFGAANADLIGLDLAETCVAGVHPASILGGNGAVTLTGTLTQTTAGQFNFSYSATPADRLEFVFTNATTMTCKFAEFAGDDLSGTTPLKFADTFFGANHRLNVHVSVPGKHNFDIVNETTGRNTSARMAGSYLSNGVTFTADLSKQKEKTFDPDAANLKINTIFTGRITAPGFELIVDESYAFQSIHVDHLVVSMDHQFNSSLSVGGVSIAIKDGRIRTVEKDGNPVEVPDFWIGAGQVLRNGTEVGAITLKPIGPRLVFMLTMGSEELELQNFLTI